MTPVEVGAAFLTYLDFMQYRNRYIVIEEEGRPVGWCTYFIGKWEDVDAFHKRPAFSLIKDDEDGPVAYIDYLVTVRWNKEIRTAIYAGIKQRHPSMHIGVWFRPTNQEDRKVVWEVPNG